MFKYLNQFNVNHPVIFKDKAERGVISSMYCIQYYYDKVKIV